MLKLFTIVGKEFPQKVVPLIDSAKFSIKIIVFDWRWYKDQPANPVQIFNQAIVRAARRNVEVLVLTNTDDIVKILNSNGCRAKKFTDKNCLHAKLMLIDDDIAVLGSHNYTQNAFTTNLELSVLIMSDERPLQFNEFFNNLYGFLS